MEQVRIKVSTEILEQRASAAEQKIQDMRNRFERIGEVVNASRSYWEGDAAEAHRREYQDYQEEISSALAAMKENVDDLRKMAGIYREAENQAHELSLNLPVDVIL